MIYAKHINLRHYILTLLRYQQTRLLRLHGEGCIVEVLIDFILFTHGPSSLK